MVAKLVAIVCLTTLLSGCLIGVGGSVPVGNSGSVGTGVVVNSSTGAVSPRLGASIGVSL